MVRKGQGRRLGSGDLERVTLRQVYDASARRAAGDRRIEGDRAGVVLVGGRRIDVEGLFTTTLIQPSSPIADQVGCFSEEGPTGRVAGPTR